MRVVLRELCSLKWGRACLAFYVLMASSGLCLIVRAAMRDGQAASTDMKVLGFALAGFAVASYGAILLADREKEARTRLRVRELMNDAPPELRKIWYPEDYRDSISQRDEEGAIL